MRHSRSAAPRPSCAHGRFHRMRAFVARRAPNFPPQASVVGVFWCHLCSTEQAAAAKERQCGTAGQQHRPSDTWQTSQSNTSSPAVGTTSSVINQTARRHIRRPRPTAAVVIMARLILALVLALAIAGAWCTFPSGGVNVFAPFAISNSHEPPAPSRPRRLPVADRGVGAVYGAFTRAYKCGASGSCAQGRRAHFRRSRPAPI